MGVETVEELRAEALGALASAGEPSALDAWRLAYLGRKGRLTSVLRGLAGLAVEERRVVGAAANALKEELEAAYEGRREALRRGAVAASIETGRLDVTLPGRPRRRGGLHPVTQTLRGVLGAFRSMGFSIIEGPEVELEYYNFEALRIPADHPARDMWDTLWIAADAAPRTENREQRAGGALAARAENREQRTGAAGGASRAESSSAGAARAESREQRTEEGVAPRLLLRTHTSPDQIRFMEEHGPPIRVAVPGRTYRFEATDPTHEWMLTQVEVLAVDEGISMAHLKGTMVEFMRRLLGRERRVRFQCSYFPFVEPGAEFALDCFVCGGEGCATCGRTGWIEMGGAGMVHAEILENMGIDSRRYTGFAAGFGVERLAMFQHGVEDIRHFYQNDLRMLGQFVG